MAFLNGQGQAKPAIDKQLCDSGILTGIVRLEGIQIGIKVCKALICKVWEMSSYLFGGQYRLGLTLNLTCITQR